MGPDSAHPANRANDPAFATQGDAAELHNHQTAPQRPHPPGGWAAIGILSLLVGACSVLANLYTGNLWLQAGLNSIPESVTLVHTPLLASTLPPLAGEYVAPRGLKKADRAVAIKFVPLDGALKDDETALLDRLLAECGQDMFPNLASGSVQNLGPSTSRSAAVDRPVPSTAFAIPGGRLELAANLATFTGGGSSIGLYETTRFDPNAHNNFEPHYSAFAINAVVSQLPANNPQITPQQLATIADRAAAVHLIADYHEPPLPNINPISLSADGLLDISIDRMEYLILPDGRSVDRSAAPQGVNVATGEPIAPQPSFTPMFPGAPALMFAQVGHCALGVLLGLTLMFAGFRFVAGNPDGAVMHYRWAIGKGVMMALEIVVFIAYVSSISDPQRSRIRFDISRGVSGMFISVIVQSVYLTTIIATLSSTATGHFLRANHTRLRLMDDNRFHAALAWMRRSPARLLLQAIGLLMGIAAILQIVVAVRAFAAKPAGDLLPSAAAAVILLLFAGGLLLKFHKPAAAGALLLICLLRSSPAIAQTRPATGPATQTSAEDAAVRDNAAAQLAAISTTDYGARSRTVQTVAKLGLPAVSPLLEFFSTSDENIRTATSAIMVWEQSKLPASPEFHRLILSYLPKLNSDEQKFEAGRIFDVIGDDPGLLDYWSTMCFDHDSNLNSRAIQNVLKIDPEAKKTLALLSDKVHEASNAPTEDYLLRLYTQFKAPGRAAELALLHDPDAQVRKHVLHHLAGNEQHDPEKMKAFMDLVIHPAADLNADEKDNPGIARSIRQAALEALSRSDRLGKPAVVALLTSKDLPDADDRMLVLNVLKDGCSPVYALAKTDIADSDWPAIQTVVAAALAGDAFRDNQPLKKLFKSSDPAVLKFATLAWSEKHEASPVPADDLISHVDIENPDVREALTAILLQDRSLAKSKLGLKFLADRLHDKPANHSDDIARRLADAGPAGLAMLIDQVDATSTGRQAATIAFSRLKDSSPLSSVLVRSMNTYSGNADGDPIAGQVVRDVLQTANEDGQGIAAGIAKVVQSGDAEEQLALATLLKDPDSSLLIGPATRARCKTILHSAAVAGPTAAAAGANNSLAAAAAVATADPFATLAWRFSGITCAVAITILLLAFTTGWVVTSPQRFTDYN